VTADVYGKAIDGAAAPAAAQRFRPKVRLCLAHPKGPSAGEFAALFKWIDKQA
jgi:hypothetical protein